jgi:hypothetical protein
MGIAHCECDAGAGLDPFADQQGTLGGIHALDTAQRESPSPRAQRIIGAGDRDQYRRSIGDRACVFAESVKSRRAIQFEDGTLPHACDLCEGRNQTTGAGTECSGLQTCVEQEGEGSAFLDGSPS